MQRGYQSRRYHDEERGEEYNTRAAYSKNYNCNDEYNMYYDYTDEGYGTYNSGGNYAHANNDN